MSPNLRYIPDTTPQRLTRPFGGSSRGRTHPGTPLSGAKRSTPGDSLPRILAQMLMFGGIWSTLSTEP